MGAALKKQEADFDEVFGNISKLYDHAENFLKIAYTESVPDQEDFFKEIENLVTQIEESANIIASDFSKVIESGEEASSLIKSRINTALRRMLSLVEEYRKDCIVIEN